MSIIWNLLLIIAAMIWVAVNVITIKMMSASEMYRNFVDGQCFVGKVCANIFYAPAWFFKGLRSVVLYAIK